MENVLVNNRVKPNVYVARSLLQEPDRRFLRLIMHCGGYFTRRQAARLRLRDTTAASDRQLRFLEWLGLLKRRRLSTDPRYPQVYKLTARALRLLELTNSDETLIPLKSSPYSPCKSYMSEVCPY